MPVRRCQRGGASAAGFRPRLRAVQVFGPVQAPLRAGYRGLQAKPADRAFQRGIVAPGRGDLRQDAHDLGALGVGAVQLAQHNPGLAEAMEQQASHMRFFRGAAVDADRVGRLSIRDRAALAVDQADDAAQPQNQIDRHHQAGGGQGRDRLVRADAGADRGGTPQRRGRVQAADVHPLLHDRAGAEEADAGHDIGGHLGDAGRIAEATGQVNEGRGAEANQRVRAQAGRTLAPLPLHPDQRTEQDGEREVQDRPVLAEPVGDQRRHGRTSLQERERRRL